MDGKYTKIVKKLTKKFMVEVRNFLKIKCGGKINPEYGLSLMMLESYYKSFIEVNLRISELDDFLVGGDDGGALKLNPLLSCRDRLTYQLVTLMKELGLTLKSQLRMNIVEPKKEQTMLDKFIADTLNNNREE